MARLIATLCGFAWFSLCIAGIAQITPSQTALYESASQAFHSGDYATALAQFEQLQQQLPAAENAEALARRTMIRYNVAVCYFKLARYDEAHALFDKLAGDPNLGWWASYNRAVIDQQQNRFAEAEDGLWNIIANTDDDQLLDLATLQYQKLLAKQASNLEPSEASNTSQWYGMFSLAYGRQDNVIDLARLDATEADDSFADVLVDLNWESLSGKTTADGGPDWQWNTFLYSTQFDEVDDADYLVLNSSVAKNFYRDPWRWSVRAGAERSQAGGEDYLGSGYLQLSASVDDASRRQRWSFNYEYQDISALSSNFEQLAGDVHEFSLTYDRDLNEQLRWTLRYNFERENRAGIQDLVSFASLSPTRNQLTARWLWQQRRWQHILSLAYRQSRYREHNQLAPRIAVQRADDRVSALLRTEYLAPSDWSLFGEWSYLDNDSNLRLYNYDESTLLLGVSKSF